MHARARLPQKRTKAKKTAVRKAAVKQNAAVKPVVLGIGASAPAAISSLAAHRAALLRQAVRSRDAEIYALVEWVGPARDDWRRGELEIQRSACMPMTAARQADGGVALTELPGQSAPLRIDIAALDALSAGTVPALVLAIPGMRITLTAADLLPALPAPARILAFPTPARLTPGIPACKA